MLRQARYLLVCSIALAFSNVITACNPRTNLSPKSAMGIIGGSVETAGDVISKSTVYIAVINQETMAFGTCTGSLLSPHLVITAAHCVTDLSTGQVLGSPYEIIVDFKNSVSAAEVLASAQAGFTVDRSNIVVHPGFKPNGGISNPNAKVNDLALMFLSTSAPAATHPAKILTDASLLKVGTAVKLAGYGPPNGVAAFPFVLRSVDSQIVQAVSSVSGQLMTQNLLSPAKKGITHGDSGGPAFISVAGNLVLFGVCSNGGVSDNDAVSGFESLPANLSWIRNAAKSLGVTSVDALN